MEQNIIEIVRFAVCILVAIVLMVKADDNNIMRRLAVAFAAFLVYCNEQIGVMTYLLIGSTLETLMYRKKSLLIHFLSKSRVN